MGNENDSKMQPGGGGLENKAFTLIELLAVIIIIGVIALIATPIIINTIGKGKKASFGRSIDGLIKSVEIDYSEDSFLAPREYFYEKRDLTLLTVEEKMRDEEIEIQGKIDGNGFIYVDEEGNIYIDNICDKEYCANGPEDDIVITPNPDGEIPSHSKTEPIIKLNGEATIYVELNGSYTELGAVAKTKLGEKLEYKTEIKKNEEIVQSIDTSIEGTYQIIYTAENDGKTATVIRTVVVADMTPVITMTEPNVNYVKGQEILITVSAIRPNKIEEFTYQINEESPVTVKGLSKTITLNETGIYEIRVTVSDNNGHKSEANKTYRIDTTGPQIVFEPEVVELESNEALGYDVLTGVSVTDNIDGTIENSRIEISGDTLLSIPGEYDVSYTVEDRLGNRTTAIRRFIVRDLTKPEIVISPTETSKFVKSQTVKIEATDNIRVDSITYVIIKDGVRGEAVSIDNGGTVTVNTTGNYQIEVTATDNSGNAKIETSGIYKIDTTKPVITFGNVTLKVDEVAGYNLMTGVSVTDNSGVTPTVTYTGGLSATIGTQTITYQATDEAGNVETKVRTFTITAATAPIISFSPIQTNGWVKSVTVTISATLKIGENLTAFTYDSISGNGQIVTVPGVINKNTGTATQTIVRTGQHKISASATGSYGNTKTETSGVYKVDSTAPEINGIDMPAGYGTSLKVSIDMRDRHSGIRYYAVTTSATAPAENSSVWKSVGNAAVETYTAEHTITANGTYYAYAKDGAGNISGGRQIKITTIDDTTPSLTVTNYSGKVGDNVALSTKYTATFGKMGGTVTCKYGTTTITNINYFKTTGTYTVSCTATGKNGKSSGAKSMTVTLKNMTGNDLDIPTIGGGKRYQGANPNNFVTFNGGAYRIIGVFNGQMKLIYWGNYTQTGAFYSSGQVWDTSGSNNWGRPSSLNTLLNSTYWNSLNASAQRMVDQSHSWGIGVNESDVWSRAQFYNLEQKTKWTGKVGLMSVADYGYASSSCSDSSSMLERICKDNNWMVNNTYNQWTIIARGTSTDNVWEATTVGGINSTKVNYVSPSTNKSIVETRPVVYLKSDVKITGGTGAANNPYQLSYEGKLKDPGNNGVIIIDANGDERYAGSNPNNWICFGSSSITNPGSCDANHKWRIIGIDSLGRMKIMTNYYYSTGKRWDTTGGTYGSNNWGRPADLKTELNGSSFYSNNTYIDATHRGYIINATWYTGANKTTTYNLQSFIDGERSNSTTGYVGLMSMVDFGYAGSGCTTSTVMTSTNNACMSNNWIGYSKYQWSITPNSSNAYRVWNVNASGPVNYNNAFNTYGVRPVVYLDSSVKITGGTGTESNPYVLTK